MKGGAVNVNSIVKMDKDDALARNPKIVKDTVKLPKKTEGRVQDNKIKTSESRTDADKSQLLQESEARLRLAVKSAGIGLWDWNLETNSVYLSPEWKSQIGYNDDEIPNRLDEWQSRVHPDDLEPTLKKIQNFIDNLNDSHEVEFRFRHKDGSYRWIYTQADVERNSVGKAVRMLGCHIDITKRKRDEEQLHENNLFISDVLDSLTSNIAVLDGDGAIRLVNNSWQQFKCQNTGFEELVSDIGTNYLDVCRDSIAKNADEYADAALTGIKAVLSARFRYKLISTLA